jgi:hypothetical protein
VGIPHLKNPFKKNLTYFIFSIIPLKNSPNNQRNQIDQTDEIDPYEFSMVYGILYSKRIFNLRGNKS